jgi:hypothetical protein
MLPTRACRAAAAAALPPPRAWPALAGALLAAGVAACGDSDAAHEPGAPDAAAAPSPLRFEHTSGTAAPGSLLWGALTLVDPDARFSSVIDEGGIFVSDPVVVAPEGIEVQAMMIPSADVIPDTRIELTLYVDAGFAPGPVDLELVYADGETMALPGVFTIADRAPVELTEGAPARGELGPLESALFRFGLSGPSIVGLSAPDASGARGTLILLGPSGSFTDQRSWLSVSGTMARDQVYAVVVGGAPDQEDLAYRLTARSAALGEATVAETRASNDTADSAQAVTLPVTISDGTVEYVPETGFGEDWYRIEVTAADAGKALAASIASPSGSYPILRVLASDGETVVAVPPSGIDIAYHEQTLFTGPLAAGTYYVVCESELLIPEAMPYSLGLGLTNTEVSP